MTVEERARELFFSMDKVLDVKYRKTIIAAFEQSLRNQIEDCAKITDKYEQSEKAESDKFRRKREPIPQATHAIMSVVCGRIGKEIRALAAPSEDKQTGS